MGMSFAWARPLVACESEVTLSVTGTLFSLLVCSWDAQEGY